MRKSLLPLLVIAALAVSAPAGEMKTFSFDCEAWGEGAPPADVFVVNGSITVKAVEKNKALEVGVGGELGQASAQLGTSAKGAASIESRILATKMGRSFPSFGIGIYGNSGYRLMIAPAKKEIQIVKGDETTAVVLKTASAEWTSGAWVKLKLESKMGADKKWVLTGKVWPADGAEPKEPSITVDDDSSKGQGKCSIVATPFSGTPIYFDDIKIEIEQ